MSCILVLQQHIPGFNTPIWSHSISCHFLVPSQHVLHNWSPSADVQLCWFPKGPVLQAYSCYLCTLPSPLFWGDQWIYSYWGYNTITSTRVRFQLRRQSANTHTGHCCTVPYPCVQVLVLGYSWGHLLSKIHAYGGNRFDTGFKCLTRKGRCCVQSEVLDGDSQADGRQAQCSEMKVSPQGVQDDCAEHQHC